MSAESALAKEVDQMIKRIEKANIDGLKHGGRLNVADHALREFWKLVDRLDDKFQDGGSVED